MTSQHSQEPLKRLALERQTQFKQRYAHVISAVIEARAKGLPWSSIQIEVASGYGCFYTARLKQIIQKSGAMPECVKAYKDYRESLKKNSASPDQNL